MNLLHFIFISLILPKNEGDFNIDDGDKISSIAYSSCYEKFPDGSVKCIEDEIPFELPERWEWYFIMAAFMICVCGAHAHGGRQDQFTCWNGAAGG